MATIKDKIGLAMLPSAQSGGASTSTTDFSGTVHSLLPIQHTGPNLVENSTFDTSSNWSIGNWTIENGVVTIDGQSGILSQLNPPLQSNKLYKWTFEITEYNSGSVKLYSGSGSDQSTYRSSAGVHTEYFVANGTGRYFYSNAFNGSIDNVSIQLVSNGDFQFERSSSATRVGSNGYIKNVEVLSDELVQNRDFEDVSETEEVTNGTFDTDSDWTLTSGWTISGGTINADNATSIAYQNIGITNGKVYKVTYEVSNYVAGIFKVQFNGSTNVFGQEVSANGTYTDYLKGNSTSNGNFSLSRSTNFTGSIDNVSVKEVGENWTFDTGWNLIDDGGDLKAQFDDSMNAYLRYSVNELNLVNGKKYRLSFNIEGSNNNLGVYNSGTLVVPFQSYDEGLNTLDFVSTGGNFRFRGSTTAGVFTVNNISIVEVTDDTDIPRLDFSNAAQPSLLLEPTRRNKVKYSENLQLNTSPQFVQSGPQALDFGHPSPDGKNNALRISGILPGTSYIALNGGGAGYTRSIYVKTYNGEDAKIKMLDINGHSEIYNINGDWQRVVNTNPVDGWLYIVDARGSGTTATDILVFGLQQEDDGSGGNTDYATSYIPTNGEVVTRNADVCNNAGDSTIFNDSEGVLFAEISSLDGDSSSNREISLSDGTTGNSIRFYFAINYENRINPRVDVGGSTVWVGSVDTLQKPIKVALRYSLSGMDFYVNGFKEVTTTTVPNFTNSLRSLQIRRGDGVTGSDFYGKTRSLLYFNEALSDAELEALTSSDITQVLRNYNRRGELLGATYESTHVQTKLNELF